ncbi:MAG: deoxyribose-phosphate aldolase [Lachnospiraceae bacterium]|nr:deoxyribose-phosphate aldolase [Lachnospiraceae bacterium]
MNNYEQILNKVDHTLLKPESTWEQIKKICDEGIEYKTASICIPPSFVKQAFDYVKGEVKICTVIGFPNGYNETAVKCFEAAKAVEQGAEEIDMVINIGWAKEGRWNDILDEINQIKKACAGRLLKVIVETCLLTDEEIATLAKIVSESDAEFIKTSTGFSTEGATFEAVKIMAENVTGGTKIKAAGGISSLEDAQKFIELGADRLGTSRVVKIVKEL